MKNTLITAFKNWSGISDVLSIQNEKPGQSTDEYLMKVISFFGIKTTAFGPMPELCPRTVFVCTHYTGALDLLAVYPYLKATSTNLKVVVNRNLLALKALREILITTYPPSYKMNNYRTLRKMEKHLKSGGELLLFPAGKVGRKINGKVTDFPWRYGSAQIIKQHAQRVIPIYVDARNRDWFYILRRFMPRLSQALMLRALVDRPEKVTRIYFGKPIAVSTLVHLSDHDFFKELQKTTEALWNTV